MSTTEWEEGTITFGAREWKPFREAVIQSHNQIMERSLRLNLRAYDLLQDKLKGLRGTKRDQAVEAALKRLTGKSELYYAFRALYPPTGVHTVFDGPLWLDWEYHLPDHILVIHAMRKPLKKDYPQAPLSKSFDASDDNWFMSLNNETRSLSWRVPEGTHACREAHSHPFTQALFDALQRVSFSRGKGGVIIGNDSAKCDDTLAGGGGNYVKQRYTPGPSNIEKGQQ